MDRFNRITQSKPIVPDGGRVLKLRDYVGRKVVLLQDLATNGGTEFRAGEVLVVEGHWRDMVHLADPANARRCIRRVKRTKVEVLDG